MFYMDYRDQIYILLLCQFDLQLIDEKYPHIVHAKVGTVDDLSAKESTNVGDQTIDTEGLFHFPEEEKMLSLLIFVKGVW